MLKHVVKAQILNLVLSGMDLVVGVLEVRLNHKSRRIAGLAGAGVIRAGVAALGLNPGDLAVLDGVAGQGQWMSHRHLLRGALPDLQPQ